jgi:hypothetical protein
MSQVYVVWGAAATEQSVRAHPQLHTSPESGTGQGVRVLPGDHRHGAPCPPCLCHIHVGSTFATSLIEESPDMLLFLSTRARAREQNPLL